MTEHEMAMLRLNIRITVRDVALEKLVGLAKSLPNGAQFLHGWASQVQSQAALQTIPGLDASMSDLLVAEYQEALKELFDEMGVNLG